MDVYDWRSTGWLTGSDGFARAGAARELRSRRLAGGAVGLWKMGNTLLDISCMNKYRR